MTEDRKGVGSISSFEDLEVFQRVYRLSLSVYKAGLDFPSMEQYVLADQVRRASKSIMCEPRGRVRQVGALDGGVQTVHTDSARVQRRDARMGSILPGPRLHRPSDVAGMAR